MQNRNFDMRKWRVLIQKVYIVYWKDMLESPLAVLEKAYELASDDTTVLNRYGSSLWNNPERMESNAKIQLLRKAEDILTKSVEKNNKRNWFAYATAQIVRKDIC